jgi:hypothetical protein
MITVNINVIEGCVDDLVEYLQSNYERLETHINENVSGHRYLIYSIVEQFNIFTDDVQKIFYLQTNGTDWELKHILVRIVPDKILAEFTIPPYDEINEGDTLKT